MGKRNPNNEITPPSGGVRFEHGGTPIYVYPDGRVWSVTNAKFNKMSTHNGGYKFIRLGSLTKYKKDFYVHHLVMKLFGPEKPSPLHLVRHRNGDGSESGIDNLEWGTHSDNMQDAFLHGTSAILSGNHNRAKLKPSQVIIIRKEFEESRKSIDDFSKEVSEKYGVIPKSIVNIVVRKTWKRI